jgi:hypothetical protein
MDLKVTVIRPKFTQKSESSPYSAAQSPRIKTHKHSTSVQCSNISTNTSSQQLSLNLQVEISPTIFEKQELSSSRKKINLAPLSSNQAKRERSMMIGKNVTLQNLIDKFLDKTTEKKAKDFKCRSFDGKKYHENAELEQSIEQFCKDEIKAYRFNLKKNLKIEKIRMSNYRRYRMRNLMMMNGL